MSEPGLETCPDGVKTSAAIISAWACSRLSACPLATKSKSARFLLGLLGMVAPANEP